MAQLTSEALKWDGRERNVIKFRTLSNGYSYVYSLDEDSNIHIFEREIAENIHEEELRYDKRKQGKIDRPNDYAWIQQENNYGSNYSDQDGQKDKPTNTNDAGTIQGERQSNGRRSTKDDSNYQRASKKITRITFDENENKITIYSDETIEKRMSLTYAPRCISQKFDSIRLGLSNSTTSPYKRLQ